MSLLGPELLIVLVLMGSVFGAGTMLLAMRMTRRRNRAARAVPPTNVDTTQE